MLFLLDANVLITANSQYYPIGQVPEFWTWLRFHCEQGHIKMPVEILEEILAGKKDDDPLLSWLGDPEIRATIALDEEVNPRLVATVVANGYAPDLADDEVEQLGRDPFLIAYALADAERCVITTEASAPGKKRQNRRIPDVCRSLSVPCHGPFDLNRFLGFSTSWKVSG